MRIVSKLLSTEAESRIEASGFFALRVAALPFDTLLNWTSALTLDPGTSSAALAEMRRALRDRLRTIAAAPRIREAIYLASPDLDREVEAWLANPAVDKPKVERAVTRYVARMAARPTPFGLFAGCGMGHLGSSTALRVESRDTFRRHTRLDHHYLYALSQTLGSRPDVQEALTFRPNSSLYRRGATWRLVRTVAAPTRRRHQLVEIAADEHLDAVVHAAKDGATLRQLAAAVLAVEAADETDADEATAYVTSLIELQLLISDLMPQVTGDDALSALVEQLAQVSAAGEAGRALVAARDKLAAIDRQGGPASRAQYEDVAATLESVGVPTESSRLFQVDLIAATKHAVLGREVLQDITEAAAVLRRLAPADESPAFRRFREDFTSRYEQRAVPLVEALDEEAGIGFDKSDGASAEHAPLLAGLPLWGTAQAGRSWSAQESVLLDRVVRAIHQRRFAISLTDEDLRALQPASSAPLPDAFSVFATILPPTTNPQDPRVWVKWVHGPSGAALLGRFCHADGQLLHAVRAHLRREEALRPEALFAEVVHTPEARVGNVLARPLLREYEIPYLGRSGAPVENQIPVTDLLVSVRDNRIVLWSRRLGREVIPRLGNAHAFHLGHGIYRFLCTLQFQGLRSGIAWRWGVLADSPCLPRVTVGRAVLSRARWRLDRRALPDRGEDRDRQLAALQEYRAAYRLPRFVAVEDGDNELPIDLDNVLSCEVLLDIVRKRSPATLVELLLGSGDLAARGPDGVFVNEVIVPFVRVAAETRPAAPVIRIPSDAQRGFAPGSEWTFLKYYTGTAGVDRLLKTVVPATVEALTSAGALDRWFFVRYGGPEWHLRLRLHCVEPGRRAELRDTAETIASQAMAVGTIHRFALDTYIREVERYGGDAAMMLSEEIFCRDSEAVLSILQDIDEDDLTLRWRVCLASWDRLLDDLGIAAPDKLQFARRMAEDFFLEFAGGRSLATQISDKYRHERRLITESLDYGKPLEALQRPLEALRVRGARTAGAIERLRQLARADPDVDVPRLARSYLHMSANRILRSAHRAHEMVLGDFLRRHYESVMARARVEQ